MTKARIPRSTVRSAFVPGVDEAAEALAEEPAKVKRRRKPRPRPRKQRSRPRRKHDAKIVEQARELRDRYLEAVNAPGSGLLPVAWATSGGGKYDVCRALGADEDTRVQAMDARLLDAA